jgi:Zn-finger nucleic acid-binding protein
VSNCVNCGAPVRIDQDGVAVCDHCGTRQDPPISLQYVEVQNETSTMCPVCLAPLSTARLSGRPLLCCPRCYGMLLAMDLFADIIDAVRLREPSRLRTAPPLRGSPNDRTIRCPSCHIPMLAHLYAGPGNVVIDSCERCGVNWLDGGELRRIALSPDTVARRRNETSNTHLEPSDDE